MELDKNLTNEHKISLEHLLQEDFFEDLACAQPEHPTDWEAHYGKTNWYMQFKCDHCSGISQVHPFCDGFRDWVHTKGHFVSCPECKGLTNGWQSVILCKRIGGNW